jgi:hypothetical protein
MITFKLENKTAEAMLSVLNATAGHASFLDDLNTQFFEQTVVDVIQAPVVEEVVVVEETPTLKKSKVKIDSEA